MVRKKPLFSRTGVSSGDGGAVVAGLATGPGILGVLVWTTSLELNKVSLMEHDQWMAHESGAAYLEKFTSSAFETWSANPRSLTGYGEAYAH